VAYIEEYNLYKASGGLKFKVDDVVRVKDGHKGDSEGDRTKDEHKPDILWYNKQKYHHQKYDFEKFDGVLKKRLTKERYFHTQGVMYTAALLAMKYQVNIYDAMTAGLLHDCGKFSTVEEQFEKIRGYDVELLDEERENPSLIHAPLGAYLAKHEFGVTEGFILDAIRYHTTGRPEMTMLEKIIYIADFIEPYRGDNWKFRKVRDLSFIDINQAIYSCAELVIAHLVENNRRVGSMTIQTLNFYGGEKIDTD
jgi:predicted HD superfamily hydrolase involved in NAD metabolism